MKLLLVFVILLLSVATLADVQTAEHSKKSSRKEKISNELASLRAEEVEKDFAVEEEVDEETAAALGKKLDGTALKKDLSEKVPLPTSEASPSESSYVYYIYCASYYYGQYKKCYTYKKIKYAWIYKDYSYGKCSKGYSYWVGYNYILVAKGCKAKFAYVPYYY